MAYLAGIAHKNLFSYGRVISTLSTQNATEILYTPPTRIVSSFIPYFYTVRHISGTPASSLNITLGTVASTYNNIGSIVYPTVVGNIGRDESADLVVNPGTSIYMKNSNALSNSTSLVFEIYLYGFYLTPY